MIGAITGTVMVQVPLETPGLALAGMVPPLKTTSLVVGVESVPPTQLVVGEPLRRRGLGNVSVRPELATV